MARATAAQLVVVASLAAAILLAAPHTTNAANATTCRDLKTTLVPCLDYAYGKVPDPSQGCCDGVKKIADREQTVNQTAACSCLKKMVVTYDLNRERAASLPSRCGVPLYWKINATADCKCKPEVEYQLGACTSYLYGGIGPSKYCCDAVKKITSFKQPISVQRNTCECIRTLIKTHEGIAHWAGNLQRDCDLPYLPYSFSATARCSKTDKTLIDVA